MSVNRNDEVSLSDKYVLLLQQTIKESRNLRAQVAAREEETDSKIERLFNKMEELCEQVSRTDSQSSCRRRKRRSTSSVAVPSQCRNDFRKMYKAMSQDTDFVGFSFEEELCSEGNKAVFAKIVESIYSDFGGIERCPWSTEQLKEASRTYYRSLNDAKRRRAVSKTEDHKRACRRQGRRRDKLGHRLAALDKIRWTEQTKSEVKEALTLDYTSSDESSYEQDSDSETPQLTAYKVKHLQWERGRLTSIKQSLDEVYLKSLPARTRRSILPRIQELLVSDREIPSNVLEWAVRRTVPAGRAMSRGASLSASSISTVSSSSLSRTFEDQVLHPRHSSTPYRSS